MIAIDLLKKIYKSTPTHAEFLPSIQQHVTNEIVHYDKGYFGGTIQLEGVPFESESDEYLQSLFESLALSFASFGKSLGDRLSIWTHLQRRRRLFDREYHFDNQFSKEFTDKYINRFRNNKFFKNSFFISFVIKYDDYDDGLKEAQDVLNSAMAIFNGYDPRVLGVYKNEHGVYFSEVYEFYAELINYERKPIPLSADPANTILGTSNLHFGSNIFEVRANTTAVYGSALSLKSFGQSKPGAFIGILDLPFEFTLSQSFQFVRNAVMMTKINRQLNNLAGVGDQAHTQHEELLEAQGGLMAGEHMFGNYHFSLIVYGETPKEADNNANMAAARFINTAGFLLTKATNYQPIMYYAQVPGSQHKPRQTPKSTVNLACAFGMHDYSHGKTTGNPIGDGSALIPLVTVSDTIYDFNFHFSNPKEDNVGEKIAGHTLILGATGTGKTTLETTLLTFSLRFNPYLFVLDLDQGMHIYLKAIGGEYFVLEGGVPTGLNPFQLPDTPYNREFLYKLVGVCGKNENGNVSADEEKIIKQAVDTVFSLDFEYRNFSTLLESIPYSTSDNSLRSRLAKWCNTEGGRYAWCLDNPRNLFNPDDFFRVGFDLTDILQDNYPPTEPVMMYLFHLRNIMMDRVAEENGILCTVIEEFWWPLKFEATQELILKALKTDRKLGGWVVLTSQSPEDAINSEIFPAIMQQTPTKVFLPNPDAKYEDSYQLTGMTKKEHQELIKLSLDSRTFLVKQSRQSAFAKLDLYGFQDEMAVLSGTSHNTAILKEVLAEQDFENPDDWYPIFKERVRVAREAKRLR
ncbi:conjugal transfer protein [Oligella urethralis]|uniref:VirB4 family type IV secretion/conjugal transfer ATPase n=1 Tax=Oligella urethralis TaxID=90245 RepID=UPI00242F05F4|nr:conjugal transfer protein [Oligella urethralis]